jgi:hypothetical protein
LAHIDYNSWRIIHQRSPPTPPPPSRSRHTIRRDTSCFKMPFITPGVKCTNTAATFPLKTFSVSGTNPYTKKLEGFRPWRSSQTHECSLTHTNTHFTRCCSFISTFRYPRNGMPHLCNECLITNSTIKISTFVHTKTKRSVTSQNYRRRKTISSF